MLYSKKRAYGETAPMIGLSVARQAHKIHSKETAGRYFLPGLNDWAIEAAAAHEHCSFQNGMDGTHITILLGSHCRFNIKCSLAITKLYSFTSYVFTSAI